MLSYASVGEKKGVKTKKLDGWTDENDAAKEREKELRGMSEIGWGAGKKTFQNSCTR